MAARTRPGEVGRPARKLAATALKIEGRETMLNRPEIRPSDFRLGEYVAHIDGATFRVRRVVGSLEQWIATCVSEPRVPPVTGILLRDVEAKLTTRAVH